MNKLFGVTVTQTGGKATPWPIKLATHEHPKAGVLLKLDEAREIAAALTDLADAIENDGYVRIRIIGDTYHSWTYQDPSKSLQVGDLVQVPFGYGNELLVGTVDSLGRGGWKGYVKDVVSKITCEPLAA